MRPTPSWLYWLTLLLVGLPVFLALGAVHERVAGSPPGILVDVVYLGVSVGAAGLGRTLLHLLWDVLELSTRRR